MKGNRNRSPLVPFSAFIDTIKNIKFSSREIDILACILGGRTTKKIASFLSLSPKTIENYIRNITLKVECNSREGIIDFVEQSENLFIIKDHYSNLLIQAEFEKSLKEISRLKNKEKLHCLLILGEEYESNLSLTSLLQKHLKLMDLTVTIEDKKELKPLYRSFSEFPEIDYIICILSSPMLEELQEGSELITPFPQNTVRFSKKILFLLSERENSIDVSRKYSEFGSENLITAPNYYFLFFEILKKILPNFNLEESISEFKKKYDNINHFHKGLYPQISSGRQKLENKGNAPQQKISYLLKKKKWHLLSVILMVGFLSIGLLRVSRDKDREEHTGKNPIKTLNQEANSIRSDFILPTEAVLLDRPELMMQMEEKLKEQGDIQTVALVGVGGAGKTTIAREYARSQSAPLIWEINAETKESLIRSFDRMIERLSTTAEDKKTLNSLQEIKDLGKREEKIFSFVKEKLKALPGWFLVYDNVENFADIQNYFPQDRETWGRGRIILTTRDSNIQNNKRVNSVIKIGELNSNQKLALFSKIMWQGNINCFPSSQIEALNAFLEKLPPFPLDISVAAYYLKATNISYSKYLEKIDRNDENFINIQENILKDSGNYIKTRHSIITLSLQELINIHKDFKDILLFISLLDSQDIPRELLEMYKSEAVVDNFLYNLKKYSFVINEEVSSLSGPTFSIHRSAQKISLAYLIKPLAIEKNKQPLQNITKVLENYITEVIEKRNYEGMDSLVTHCQMLLTHNLFTNAMKGSIGVAA